MNGRPRRLTTALVAACCLAVPAMLAAPGQVLATGGSHHSGAADAAVITQWSAIAARTIYTDNATPIPSSSLYFGFVDLAVYDAVVTVEGGYEPYLEQPRPRRRDHASSQAAAATAAYQVLRTYFPTSADALLADYTATMAALPDGVSRTRGQQVGQVAADQLIRARRNDGRGAPITLDVTPAPGVWRPTSVPPSAMIVPWLAFTDPLLLTSPTQIRLPGPDPITSRRYAGDLNEAKAYGAKDGSVRTVDQTETALFWNANSVLQYRVALADQVTRRGLDIGHAARAFAILGATTADAVIECWRGKYDNAYWRPVTAIQQAETDGNRATAPDPTWTPLVGTPPYPEYPSGHACITGAASASFGTLFGARNIDLDVASSGTKRHFDTTSALDAETMNARIWLGLHFRKAMTDGNRLGHRVADYGTAHYFEPER